MSKRTFLTLMAAALALAPLAAPAWAIPQATSTTNKTTTPAHPATAGQRPGPSLLKPASLKLQAPAVFNARFTTSRGFRGRGDACVVASRG